ncbi:unnamed protein product [Pleuronectes platessa]|uniref:Uncharacterized protein n=1 Tax=Pleuronectes platessa TaxID=8262 RepID=A0A9N7TM14_PLEPL|nr:unnamed protein product [Pleuronectes platessa]
MFQKVALFSPHLPAGCERDVQLLKSRTRRRGVNRAEWSGRLHPGRGHRCGGRRPQRLTEAGVRAEATKGGLVPRPNSSQLTHERAEE